MAFEILQFPACTVLADPESSVRITDHGDILCNQVLKQSKQHEGLLDVYKYISCDRAISLFEHFILL